MGHLDFSAGAAWRAQRAAAIGADARLGVRGEPRGSSAKRSQSGAAAAGDAAGALLLSRSCGLGIRLLARRLLLCAWFAPQCTGRIISCTVHAVLPDQPAGQNRLPLKQAGARQCQAPAAVCTQCTAGPDPLPRADRRARLLLGWQPRLRTAGWNCPGRRRAGARHQPRCMHCPLKGPGPLPPADECARLPRWAGRPRCARLAQTAWLGGKRAPGRCRLCML